MNELNKRGHEGVGSDIALANAGIAVDMAEDDGKIEAVRRVNVGATQNIADVCKKLDYKMLYLSKLVDVH